MRPDNYYRTTDLYLASYLHSKGFELAGKQRDGTRVTILFADASEIQQAVLEFYNGDAKRLFDSFRTLKDYAFAP